MWSITVLARFIVQSIKVLKLVTYFVQLNHSSQLEHLKYFGELI